MEPWREDAKERLTKGEWGSRSYRPRQIFKRFSKEWHSQCLTLEACKLDAQYHSLGTWYNAVPNSSR